MTRERAIQIMSNYDLNFHEVNEKLFDYGEVAEAFDMAIKALEGADLDGYSSRLWKAAYERGKAEADQRWIPVSERLPSHDEYIKNSGLFNVSDGNRSYSEWFDFYEKKWFGEPTMTGFRVDYAVTAWRPLPKPYTAESD